MKVVVDSKFQKDVVTIVEYSSSEENPQIENIEDTIDQTLEYIEKHLQHLPKFPEEDHKDKGKQRIS